MSHIQHAGLGSIPRARSPGQPTARQRPANPTGRARIARRGSQTMKRPASTPRSPGRAVVRVSTIVMVAGLTALAVFALSAQRGVVDKASAARTANRLAGGYEDSPPPVGQTRLPEG